MKTDFLPKRDGDLNAHEINFVTKLNVHAAVLGMDTAEVTETINIVNDHKSAYEEMNSKRAESKSASEKNQFMKKRALREIRRIAKKIKTAKTYTDHIGEDLQIIGPDSQSLNLNTLKPVLKVSVNGQEVVLNFRKDGTDGIKIYCKRGAETEFTYLSLDTSSPYNDNRVKLETAKPEQREYYANFFVEDKEIGQKSDIVTVIIP